MNVSDFLVKRLCDWGVQRIYGYPGDGINGIIGAVARGDSGRRAMLEQSLKAKLKEYLPGRS